MVILTWFSFLTCIIHERRKKLKKVEICLQILVLLKLDKTKSKINLASAAKISLFTLKKAFLCSIRHSNPIKRLMLRKNWLRFTGETLCNDTYFFLKRTMSR
jgi:hypothetical protein